jgi:hypothetical protein
MRAFVGVITMHGLTFGQAQPVPQWTEAQSIRLLITIGLLIVAVVALGTILLAVRRKMLAGENDLTGARSLLDELRSMRDSGEMTIEEYDAAKKALTTRVAGALKTKDGTPGPRASYAPKLPRSAMPPPSAQTARPGYDLTGERLPAPRKNARPDATKGDT